MRDIRGDLQERAILVDEQIRAAVAHFDKAIQQLQTERDARIADLKAGLAMIAKFMEFEERFLHNTPPVIRFEPNGKGVQGPLASLGMAPARTASLSTPIALPLWAADDMKYTSGTSAPVGAARPPVTVRWSKYRGPGSVTFDKARPDLEKLPAGEGAYSGKASATAKFGEAGDYVLHLTANDYSGDGGGGFGCCWTTALMKVSVKP
jgi:hypothetical protein